VLLPSIWGRGSDFKLFLVIPLFAPEPGQEGREGGDSDASGTLWTSMGTGCTHDLEFRMRSSWDDRASPEKWAPGVFVREAGSSTAACPASLSTALPFPVTWFYQWSTISSMIFSMINDLLSDQ